ncbi:MAG: DUF2947 domain-containing protein [Clostridiales bacterium]|nr:DUF2947 domain-containing protein [Clostridiales bacterium]
MNYKTKFFYANRFVNEKYNKLPANDLKQIKELTKKQSLIFWNRKIKSKINYFPIKDIYFSNKSISSDCGWGNDKTENNTREFLKLIYKKYNHIYFFWDHSHGIKTTWDIFVKYWSDFCYCSDFGNIIYISSDLILIYHEDALLQANYKSQNL